MCLILCLSLAELDMVLTTIEDFELQPTAGLPRDMRQLVALASGAGSVATNPEPSSSATNTDVARSISVRNLMRSASAVEAVQRNINGGTVSVGGAGNPSRRIPAVYPGIASEHTIFHETKAFLRRKHAVLKMVNPSVPLTWVRNGHFSLHLSPYFV